MRQKECLMIMKKRKRKNNNIKDVRADSLHLFMRDRKGAYNNVSRLSRQRNELGWTSG